MKFGNDNESVVREPRAVIQEFHFWLMHPSIYKAPISHSSQEKGYIPKRNKTPAFLILLPDTYG